MQIYWCTNCKTPIINKKTCTCGRQLKYLSSDLRPVFPEERLLMYNLTHNEKFLQGFVWASRGLRYYFNGEHNSYSLKTMGNSKLTIDNFLFNNNAELNKLYNTFNAEIENFIYSNSNHLNQLQYYSSEIVKNSTKSCPNNIAVVSFSGGKDSTVVSHLVRTSLSNPSILHIFGDTKLEFPFTYEYINRFRNKNPRTPLLSSKSHHDFMELCDKIGPPSRVMSWCCTVFKTGPLNQLIKSISKDSPILTFYGIRESESAKRSSYQNFVDADFMGLHKTTNIDTSPKIHNQKVISPIFKWYDIEIWLYIFTHYLDFNYSYRLGYSRVGCWCCPNNSSWSAFLSKIFLPEESKNWHNFLVKFAKRVGKKDAETYVDTGKWKARQGGAGLYSRQINIEAKTCVEEEFSRTVSLTKPITEELYEYMKPFGLISTEMGKKLLNEVFILNRYTNKPLIKIQGKTNTYNLKITAINPENYKLLSQRIDCQIRKYQSCIKCLGCVSVCPHNAIQFNDNMYSISEEYCVGCLECINPWRRGGCLMVKVLSVKKG